MVKESRQMNQLTSLLSQDTSSMMMDTSDTSSLPAILEVPMSSQSRLVTSVHGPSILQQLMAQDSIVTTANITHHQQQPTPVSVQPSVLTAEVLGLPTRVETVTAAPTVHNLQNVQVADPQQVLNMLLSLQKQQQQQQTIQQQVLTFPSNVALVVQGKDSQPLSFITPAVQQAHQQPISATTINFSHLGTLQNQTTTVTQALPTNPMFVSAAPQPQGIPSNVPTIYPKLAHHASESMLQKTEREDISRRASTGSLNKLASEPYKHSNKGSGNRKDRQQFAVPQKSTRVPVSRVRNIAPATQQPEARPAAKKPAQPSQLASKNTFLAQLLTQADDSGETNKWNEKSYSSVFQPIRPAATVTVEPTSPTTTTTTSLPSSKNFMGSSFTDFQKTVFLGAASQALGTRMTDAIKDQVLTAVSTHGTFSEPDSPFFHAPSPGSDSGTPCKIVRQKSDVDKQHYIEQRKVSHLTAEQKRRGNIKVCFETLTQIIPTVNQNAKISKAVTLQKGSEYCRKLKQDRMSMKDEAAILKQEIEGLNGAISRCQSQLPATGVPVTRQRADKMREMFDEYVRNRTVVNWKFFIFSIIIRPLFESYSNQVSTADMDQLCRTVLAWLEQHCSLVELRPGVLNSLKQLCTSTSILSDPSKVPEQATQAVTYLSKQES
eukprot:GHVU01210239.1.p1 GENE.GHVU01210239.1~~GHVU01210239.1.p1  ORF type:complete len:661 (-),score=65.98 GHVU01210239.1:1336-3318(-)